MSTQSTSVCGLPAPVKKQSSASEPNGADVDELKKLKSFMTACNERKVWGKEFPKLGLDTTKSQIRYLRDRLKELGMPSRLSMEAAKKIGARRALEKEARDIGIDIGKAADGAGSDGEAQQATDVPRPKRAAAARRPLQPPKQKLRIDSEDEETASDDNAGNASESDASDAKSQEDGTDGSGGESGSESSSSAHSENSDA